MSSSKSTSADLAARFAELEAFLAEAGAAPLSRKKAMLVALLVDRFIDRLAAYAGAEDVLVFREDLAAASPPLALTLAVAAITDAGPRLVTEAVAVPLADYASLSVEDFMVSLYNHHSVQRVRIVTANGTRHDTHEVLREAIAFLRVRVVSSAG